jgi:hypothetical protein
LNCGWKVNGDSLQSIELPTFLLRMSCQIG